MEEKLWAGVWGTNTEFSELEKLRMTITYSSAGAEGLLQTRCESRVTEGHPKSHGHGFLAPNAQAMSCVVEEKQPPSKPIHALQDVPLICYVTLGKSLHQPCLLSSLIK